MPPPTVDPTDSEALMKELFSDERWAKDQFTEHLSDPLLALCEALAGCLRSTEKLKNAAGQINTQRISLVAAFMYGVLDDLVRKLCLRRVFEATQRLRGLSTDIG
jgi:hypothetical protein